VNLVLLQVIALQAHLSQKAPLAQAALLAVLNQAALQVLLKVPALALNQAAHPQVNLKAVQAPAPVAHQAALAHHQNQVYPVAQKALCHQAQKAL
jgi:hypothetical protein